MHGNLVVQHLHLGGRKPEAEQSLLHKPFLTNKDLLYSTRSPTQHSVVTYMGKESKLKKRVGICICIAD